MISTNLTMLQHRALESCGFVTGLQACCKHAVKWLAAAQLQHSMLVPIHIRGFYLCLFLAILSLACKWLKRPESMTSTMHQCF